MAPTAQVSGEERARFLRLVPLERMASRAETPVLLQAALPGCSHASLQEVETIWNRLLPPIEREDK
uniref:Uncharacterized protein n=1 Tax=Thermogemmatispora argillosa TaxID=2045280 RepID=A0A455T0B2_9CHLR|nr:hypothetical protein KTA_08210 [Thermogemmatispora argillosa]